MLGKLRDIQQSMEDYYDEHNPRDRAMKALLEALVEEAKSAHRAVDNAPDRDE